MEDEEEGRLVVYNTGLYDELWEDKEGLTHRLNGPAVIYAGGDTIWYKHGKLHRENGPAREWPHDDVEEWYKDGKPYEPSAHELMLWKMKKKKEC